MLQNDTGHRSGCGDYAESCSSAVYYKINSDAPDGTTPQAIELGYSYRISPRITEGLTQLRCRDTLHSTPPEVVRYEYVLATACGDLDFSRAIDMNDLSAWANEPADVDNNGAVDADDLNTLVGLIAD